MVHCHPHFLLFQKHFSALFRSTAPSSVEYFQLFQSNFVVGKPGLRYRQFVEIAPNWVVAAAVDSIAVVVDIDAVEALESRYHPHPILAVVVDMLVVVAAVAAVARQWD